MTPEQFQAALKKLKLTETEAAREFRLRDSRSIRHYKTGDRKISGPLSLAIEYRLKHGPLDAQ